MIGLGLDNVLLIASIGSGLFGAALGGYMMHRARMPLPVRTVDKIVQTAPYARLHNVITVKPHQR